MIIEDTTNHPIASKLDITSTANIGSYLGVPIILEDNTMFGTLCAVDPSPYKYKNSDLELMQTLANFIANAVDLGQAYERIVKEEKRVKMELDIAKKIQTSVLSEPITTDNIRIKAFYQSSESLSGDMYCWFPISPTQYGVILIDVMGHGVSSALISMSIRSLMKGLITTISNPIEVIKELNHHIYHLFNINTQTTYATAVYVKVDTEAKTIEYSNAGHPSGLVVVNNSMVKRMDSTCIVLGVFPEIEVVKNQLHYEYHANILLYTDGILELINPCFDESMKELELVLRNTERNQDILVELQEKYVAGKSLKDDVCLIAIDVK